LKGKKEKERTGEKRRGEEKKTEEEMRKEKRTIHTEEKIKLNKQIPNFTKLNSIHRNKVTWTCPLFSSMWNMVSFGFLLILTFMFLSP
jgi:hypothetical protein